MRIAIDARKLTRADSGCGSYTLNLVQALLKEDQNIELVLICNAHRGQGRVRDPRVTEVLFPFPPISPFTRLALGPFLRKRQFDVFHSPFESIPLGLHMPQVVTVHDINWILNPHYNSTHPLFRLVLGTYYRANLIAAMREAHRILAISHGTRRAIIEHAPWYEAKLRVTYNGIDHGRVYPLDTDSAYRAIAHLMPMGTPFVLTVGQGTPYKNHRNAIRGFLEAFGERSEYRMVLVRRFAGLDKELDALLQSPRGQERVLTLPYVTPDVLNALYNAARIVLHPSYNEGFGLPLIEAMAVGTPVVTSNVSVMPEIVGPAALLVSPADFRAIAKALRTLDCDEALRARLIAEGHKRLECFSWSKCAQATLAVYRELA